MVFIFPLIGIILGALDMFINPPYSAGFFPGFVIYSIEYTLIAAIIYVTFLVIVAAVVDLDKPNEKFSDFYNNVAIFTLKIALSACNVKTVIEGEEKIPKEPFLLIQNHKAMFDPIVTLTLLGKYRLGFITKPENFNLPIINKLMHRVCCIAIDRENPRNAVKSINGAAENIKNGVCSMVIYPEGTRARDREMLDFHAGSFKIATKSGAPIVVTTIDNTNLVHRNAPFKKTVITLRVCGVIPAEEVLASSTAELSAKSRKMMCESLSVPYEE